MEAKSGFKLLAVLLGGTLVLTGCSIGSSSSSKVKTPITIGVLAPLTGGSAADGAAMKQGAELAVKEINADGGVAGYTFDVKAIDTQDLKADLVAAGAQSFISDSKVKLVVTAYASADNFEIAAFAKANMPYMVAANSDQTRDIIKKDPTKYPTIWSLAPDYAPFGTELPKVIEKWNTEGKLKLRDKSAFIITSDNPFSVGISNGLRKTLTARGWKIVGDETVPYGTVNDWGSILSKVRKTNPDLIINTDYIPSNEATFMRQFRANPTNSLIFLQYGPAIPEFLTLTKKDSNGVLYNLLGDPITSTKYQLAQDEIKKVRDAFGADVSLVSIQTYEMVKMYAAALKKIGDPDKKLEIGKEIGSMTWPSAAGSLVFDQSTHLVKSGDDFVPLQFLQIRDGKRIQLLPEKYSTGAFVLPDWFK